MAKSSKQKIVLDYLLTYIDQNKFTSNTKLPSEIFLTKRLSVCRETVRRAIKALEDKGLVYAIHGGGTYFDKQMALSLSSIDSSADYRIAIIIQGKDRGANSTLISSVKDYFKDEKVDIRIFYTDNKLSNERRCLLSCRQGFDGIIEDGENGFLCEAGNADELVKVIARIKKMPSSELQRISSNAILTATRLTDRQVAQDYLQNVELVIK